MQALVYTATKVVEIQEVAEPAPGDGEVVVNITAVGICGSDMHAYLGHDERRVPPLVLGHEAAGTVATGPRQGMPVVLNPLITCGHCNDCLDGRQNLCAERDLIGMYRPGAFAQAIAIPEQNLIPIPDGMDPALAALTEPAATAVHGVNLAAKVSPRPLCETECLVIGGGSVGLFAALALAEQGVRRITLAETNALRRNTAADTGVCDVMDPITEMPSKPAFDVIVDAVGSGRTRAMSSALVRAGGTIIHIGLADSEAGLDTRRLTLQEVVFIGTYTYTPLDLRATLLKLHAGALGDLSWLEQRDLAEGASAFSDLLEGRTPAPKIVLRP